MHHKKDDYMTVCIWDRFETVRIKNVYAYPNGAVAYGFYSDITDRNVLERCACRECSAAHAREPQKESFIGDPKRAVLIKL